jgi:hypothetical protein
LTESGKHAALDRNDRDVAEATVSTEAAPKTKER